MVICGMPRCVAKSRALVANMSMTMRSGFWRSMRAWISFTCRIVPLFRYCREKVLPNEVSKCKIDRTHQSKHLALICTG